MQDYLWNCCWMVMLGLGFGGVLCASWRLILLLTMTRIDDEATSAQELRIMAAFLLLIVSVLLGLFLCVIRTSFCWIRRYDKSSSSTAAFNKEQALAEIQAWLFEEGGHQHDVRSLMAEYCFRVRKLGLPVDRLFVGSAASIVQSTQAPVMVWRWQVHQDFYSAVVPRHKIIEHRANKEPFAMMMDRSVDAVRMRASDNDELPPDCCQWFVKGQFTDYLALAILSRNEFAGGLAWATQDPAGFSEDHIWFFKESLSAFGIVMRLHSNDCVVNLLTTHLEEQVAKRTQELKISNLQLEAANKLQAQQSARQLKHFGMMSHELRSPLNAILGLSSVLMMDDSPPGSELNAEQRESVQLISASGDLLRGIVDDVLNFSKLELGKIVISWQQVNLLERLEMVVKAVEFQGAGAGRYRSANTITSSSNNNNTNRIRIRCTYDANLPTMIYTDGRRLQQVLFNIFSNAVKFSQDESNVIIDFKVDMARDDNNGNDEHNIVFRVKDYGLGIQKKDMEHIFEPFNQLTQETQSVYGGCGLGLPITAKIVEGLGGRITVDSVPGEWCEFAVHLPYYRHDSSSNNTDQCQVGESSHSQSSTPGTDLRASANLSSLDVANDRNDGDDDDDDDSSSTNTSHQEIVQVTTNKSNATIPLLDETSGDESTIASGTGSDAASKLPGDGTSRLKNSRADDTVDAKDDAPAALVPTTVSNTVAVPTNPILEKATDKKKDIKDLRLLVAEDNAINVKVLDRILSRLGLIHVDVVGDGKQAVESSASKQYDVIFMDLQMPIMDGLEATRLIVKRRTERGEASPKIVFLTAHALDSYRLQVEEAGGDAFLSKPYKLQDIQNSLESLVIRDSTRQ